MLNIIIVAVLLIITSSLAMLFAWCYIVNFKIWIACIFGFALFLSVYWAAKLVLAVIG